MLLLPSILWASMSVQNTPTLGGIAVVDFESKHHNPKAFYRATPLYVQHIKGTHWQVLIGIPLLEKPGKKSITVQGFSTQTLSFEVKKHAYKEQHITLKGKNKKYINLNLAHTKRIQQERPILTQARTTFSAQSLSKGVFTRPVDGVTTSPFGLKRFYNGKARRPHTGLDYAGTIGTPIKAPADGKVILTGEYFFNGKTIFLDHGQGLISAYIHLNKHLIKLGQQVKQGEIIGEIGQSGRSTGPHLHWSVYLNRTAINPKLLLDQ